MNSQSQSWKNYEELARHVILHFADIIGITAVEAKQRLQGKSGKRWEIDAKGICSGGKGFLVIECKERSKSRLRGSTIGALAFTVQDIGAAGAVIVTSIGLQKGAEKLAKHQGFHAVYLPKESTFEDYVARCGNCILHKLPPEKGLISSPSLTSISVFGAEQGT